MVLDALELLELTPVWRSINGACGPPEPEINKEDPLRPPVRPPVLEEKVLMLDGVGRRI